MYKWRDSGLQHIREEKGWTVQQKQTKRMKYSCFRGSQAHCVCAISEPRCVWLQAVRTYKIFIHVRMTCLSHLSENALILLKDITEPNNTNLWAQTSLWLSGCACVCLFVCWSHICDGYKRRCPPSMCHEQPSRKRQHTCINSRNAQLQINKSRQLQRFMVHLEIKPNGARFSSIQIPASATVRDRGGQMWQETTYWSDIISYRQLCSLLCCPTDDPSLQPFGGMWGVKLDGAPRHVQTLLILVSTHWGSQPSRCRYNALVLWQGFML